MGQCKGTTKKGERCKIRIDDSAIYCHYHVPKPVVAKQFLVKPQSPTKNKPGFIYLYTLEHLISPQPTKQPWLQIHKFAAPRAKSFNPRTQILVKIGCTTSTVTHRLKQWELQCGHRLALVNPYNTREVLDRVSLMINRFAMLSIAQPRYRNFKFDELGFAVPKDVLPIEKKIHALLRESYGYGSIYCGGCSSVEGKYRIHVEWFLIPRRDIDKVFKIIDHVIERNK